MNAVERRLGDAAQQAGCEGRAGGLAHQRVVVAQRNRQDRGGRAEAGEVPGAHGALDEVVAEGVDVHQHQRVERPVQAKRHQERVEHRDQEREDERCVAVHPRQPGADPGAEQVTERADDEGGDRDHYQQRQERHEHHVHRGRDDLLQRLVQQRGNGGHDQGHEDVAVVAVMDHRQAEDVDHVGWFAEDVHHASVWVFIQRGEVRGEQREHDCSWHPRVDTELLARVVRDSHRQEEEHGAPHGVHELPARRLHLRVEVHQADRVEERGEGDD